MNHPFQMHIIETQVEVCQTLTVSIPSPFEEGSIIKASVELHANPNDQMYAEMWGSLPKIPSLPEHRVKIASGYISLPDVTPTTFGQFMDVQAKAVLESKFFKDGTKLLLDLYADAAYSSPKNEDN